MRFDAALTGEAYSISVQHLLQHYRADKIQEDLCFALWRPSTGRERLTALIDEVILPEDGERLLHGNASFQPQLPGPGAGIGTTKGGRIGVHAQSPESGVARHERCRH